MSETESVATSGAEEDLSKYQGDKGTVLRWLKEYDLVRLSKAQKNYERVGEKVVKNYRNASGVQPNMSSAAVSAARVMFNVLWSNIQILKPCLYARMPKVVVERRFKDQDPVGRLAAQIAERATSYMLDSQKDRFNFAVKSAVEDRLLPGRGQCWVRYDVEFEEARDENGECLCDEEGEPLRQVKPNSERAIVDYVFWQDFFISPARNPFEVRWVMKKAYMTRAELVKRFGDIGKLIKLTKNPDGARTKLTAEEQAFLMQAEVLEFWDKESKNVFWISEGYKDGPLDVKHDPLRLKDFFPCPIIPLLATTTTDSMYPTADYVIYERLSDELNYVTKRISGLIDCIRMVGITSASLNEKLKNILKLEDGQLFPSDSWVAFSQNGGFKGAIDWVPFEQAVNALGPLIEYAQSLREQIDFITGIPDVARGATDPTETAAAIQRKSHWISLKVEEKQADVQRFCRDIIGKIAEIIFEPGLFSDETISLMCGFGQLAPDDQENYGQALQLLRDDRLQTFRVDIETDSTIAIDEEEERSNWMNYLQSMQSIVGEIEGISQFRPELLHPMIESAKAAVRTFRNARGVEGAWDRAWKEIEDNIEAEKEAQANQPTPPDYEQMKIQVQSEANQIKAQDLQLKAQEVAISERKEQFDENYKTQELTLKAQAQEMKFEIDSQMLQIEGLKVQSRAQYDQMAQELEKFKENFSQVVQAQTLELERYKTVMDEKEKLITEVRLQKQEQMEQMKFAHEHALALKEAAIAEKQASAQSGQDGNGVSSPKLPDIHVHVGGNKSIKIKRNEDGTLEGTSSSVDEGMPGL